MITRVMLFVISIVILVLIFPGEGKFKYEFSKGKPWMHEDLVAPFDFAILKSAQELEREKYDVLNSLKPYFRFDDNLYQKQKEILLEDFNDKWDRKYSDKASNKVKKEKHLQLCINIYDSIMHHGIIEVLPETQGLEKNFTVLVIRNNIAEERLYGSLLTISSAVLKIHKWVSDQKNIDENFVISVLENALIQNIRFDTETTEKEKKMH